MELIAHQAGHASEPLPSDWHSVELGTLLRHAPSYGINAAAVPLDARLPAYLRITDITEDSRLSRASPVSVDHRLWGNYLLEPGDLVFARTGASVGKSYLYQPEDGPLVYAGFLIRVCPNPAVLVPRFLAFFVQTRRYRAWVATNSMRSGQPGLNGRQLAELPVALPPTIAEQSAIAEAISDADRLVASLERLIAKKRRIKRGAMQELLTGRRRLPGFEGEWQTRRLGDAGETFGGLTGKAAADFGHGDARYIPFMNIIANVVIKADDLQAVDVAEGERQNAVRRGDLFFNGSSETPEEVGLCAVLDRDLGNTYVNSFCFGFRPHGLGDIAGLFLAYFFRGGPGRELLRSLAQGATRYNLSKRALMNLVMELPPFSEQQAIAAVLADMDAEIAALESKLEKARSIKQGMMQQLLTGRIRLLVAEAEAEAEAEAAPEAVPA